MSTRKNQDLLTLFMLLCACYVGKYSCLRLDEAGWTAWPTRVAVSKVKVDLLAKHSVRLYGLMGWLAWRVLA